MNRRNFLKTSGALGVPTLFGAGQLAAAPLSALNQLLLSSDTDRVLVLIQLTGGNDGLHTLVPLDQYANLAQVRSNIILPQNSLLGLTPNAAFHPVMSGMQNLFLDGKLSAIQSVGYPNQNRSHFRSMDIWTSASAADVEETTGWMGRILTEDHPDFPTGYPNPEFQDPLAMVMGTVVSATCQGEVANFSLAVRDPFNFTYIAPGSNTPIPDNNYGDELLFVRQTIAQSNAYGDRVTTAANAGDSQATYPETRLGEQLRNIATLISGGLQTKIYIATIGGFDTHANQIDSGDSTQGEHANLLADLSASIAAFSEDLTSLGLEDRVLGMTYSEFGRRIRSNQSFGTDHGTAAPLFLFGSCVAGGILGNSPIIDPQVDPYEGVPMQYDFRDVYGSVMTDWLDLDINLVESLIYPGFTYLPILQGCALLPVEWLSFSALGRERDIRLEWQTATETGNLGFEIERSTNGRDFSRIDFVRGVGISNSVQDYEYLDRTAVRGPLYYYRLKQLDNDGRSSYSPVRTARLSGTAIGDWQVGLPAPNPVDEQTTIQIFAPVDARADFELFDQQGRRLQAGQLSLIGGRDNRIPLSVGQLPAGVYTWRVKAGGQSHSRRLIKR